MPNKFDRIIQENFNELTKSLINRIIDVQQAEIIKLPRKIQRTLEREMDTLVKIVSAEGFDCLVNVEWQTDNDPKMCMRMLLYHAISAIVHELPVIGIVVYIGKEKLNMTTSMETDNLKYNYRLIDLTELNPGMFLQSDIPEEIIMAVLAGKTKRYAKREIIKKILYKLHLILQHDSQELDRRIAQFEIIGELRDVQEIIIKEETHMAITYNIEKDIRYNQGLERGVERGIGIATTERNIAFAKYLLQHTSHSDIEIAKLVSVSVDFVTNLRSKDNQ